MFKIEGKKLLDDSINLGTIKPNYLSPYDWQSNIPPKSVFIILDSKFKQTASPHFLKSIRKFIRTECNTSFAIIQWF